MAGMWRSRNAVRRATAIGGACALVGLGVLSAGATASAATTPSLTVLTGEVVHGLSGDTDQGAVTGDPAMVVGVELVVDTAARNAAYSALFTPGSPTYHDYYTPATFNAAFGVDQAAADRARAYVTRDGLKITYANPDGSYMEISGTTSQVDSTFKIAEHKYLGPTGGAFTANTVGPTVTTDIAAIAGLTSLTTATTPKAAKAPTGPTPADDTCEALVPTGPAAGLNACLGALTPQDVRDVYQVPKNDLGNGQKVAIFGEGELANVISDLRKFESVYNQPEVPVKELLIGDDLSDNSGDGEWDLDSQAITGMAPDLQELDFYFGSNLADPSITATYNAWVNDPAGPLTGNSSFGGSEQLEYLDGFIEDMPLQQAAMEGRTMFTSAGDVGGSCLPGENGATNTGAPCVEYPASSPYVVGVGGNVLYTQATLAGKEVEPATRALEYSWTYSGGGHSDFEAAPSWQTKAFPTGTGLPCASGPGALQTCRGVPDVSALSGDIVTNGYAYVNMGAVSEEGGTSLSSPLWAGAWANVQAAFVPNSTCANPALVTATPSASGAGAGFAPPELYAVGENTTADPESFFDVGGATNSVPGAGNGQQTSLPRSPTDPTGYDYVSGLGSPILSGLINNLDCGHTTATTPTTYPTTPAGYLTVIQYGTTPPYNTPSEEGCNLNGQLDDPTGDATIPDPAGDAYDITHVSLTSDGTSTTFATTLVALTGSAANDVDYAIEFSYGAGQYAVTVDTGASPTAELYELTTTSTPAGLDVQLTPTALAALTPVINTTTNTVSTTMPFTAFNSQTPAPSPAYGTGSQLEQVVAFTSAGPATTALANDFNVDPIDQADFLQCPYNVMASSPPPSLGESPLTVALPILGFGIVGVFFYRRNRRNTARATA